jgi:hypothetical protein
MPRTVFYERFIDAVRRNSWFREAGATLVIPAEDTAQETNWPRYGDQASAFTRGEPPDLKPNGVFVGYLNAVVQHARANPAERVLVLNMHPFVRLSASFKPVRNVIVADGSLAAFERAANPRTISFPALPIVRPSTGIAGPRTILASFQGAASHPVRAALASLHDGKDFVVNLIDPKNHAGRIDAEKGRTDTGYEDLLDQSEFSLVPRGDALFSYRLLEVMARGSIPVILSDGWVLPFDRTVDWPAISLSFHHEAVPKIPETLRSLTPADRDRLRTGVIDTYQRIFADMDRIVDTLLREAAGIHL